MGVNGIPEAWTETPKLIMTTGEIFCMAFFRNSRGSTTLMFRDRQIMTINEEPCSQLKFLSAHPKQNEIKG